MNIKLTVAFSLLIICVWTLLKMRPNYTEARHDAAAAMIVKSLAQSNPGVVVSSPKLIETNEGAVITIFSMSLKEAPVIPDKFSEMCVDDGWGKEIDWLRRNGYSGKLYINTSRDEKYVFVIAVNHRSMHVILFESGRRI